MTLPASGAISFGQIQTEFGGANPIGINEYYRGGTYVSAGALSSIPTSGAISLSNFYGASAVTYQNPSFSLGYTNAVSGIKQVRATFNTDGTVAVSGGTSTSSGKWWTTAPSAGVGTGKYVKYHVDSITATTRGGTMAADTWYQMNVQQYITFSNSSSTGEGYGTFTVYFSNDGINVAATLSGQTWDVGYVP